MLKCEPRWQHNIRQNILNPYRHARKNDIYVICFFTIAISSAKIFVKFRGVVFDDCHNAAVSLY
jgi:hypothetical protein